MPPACGASCCSLSGFGFNYCSEVLVHFRVTGECDVPEEWLCECVYLCYEFQAGLAHKYLICESGKRPGIQTKVLGGQKCTQSIS